MLQIRITLAGDEGHFLGRGGDSKRRGKSKNHSKSEITSRDIQSCQSNLFGGASIAHLIDY